MPISSLGYIGIGLVWGWWVGGIGGRISRPLLDALAVSTATVIFSLGIAALAGLWPLLLFLCAGGLTLYLHLAWRQELKNRFGPPGIWPERRADNDR